MNHDMTHCADYRKSRCPKSCELAQLTKDLFDLKSKGELLGIPMSFAHFRECDLCPRPRKEKADG